MPGCLKLIKLSKKHIHWRYSYYLHFQMGKLRHSAVTGQGHAAGKKQMWDLSQSRPPRAQAGAPVASPTVPSCPPRRLTWSVHVY